MQDGLFHPRCRHGVSTFYEGINDEPEDVTKVKHNDDKNDKYTQYLKQRQKQYERLALGSLLPENVINYKSKAKELRNQIDSSKIELTDDEQYAINQYISSESYKINGKLRNNVKLDKIEKTL